MKNKPILRWALIGILRLVMLVIGLIIVPFLYPIRDIIRDGQENGLWIPHFFWWFLSEKIEGDKDSGDYGRYKHNFWGYYWQTAIRNPVSNFRNTILTPKKGEETLVKSSKNTYVYDIKTGKRASDLMFCNIRNFWGFQNVRFKVEDTLYFRYSFSYKVFNRVFNVQFGTNKRRYLYKIRFSRI